jgi:hypothetical protein
LAAEIVPLTPVVPLAQVSAPAFPFQNGLKIRKLPLLKVWMEKVRKSDK